MFLNPISFILNFISGLVSLLILGFGIYFYREYENATNPNFQRMYLLSALILFTTAFLGRLILRLFFALARVFMPNHVDPFEVLPPSHRRCKKSHDLDTSDGSKIHLEFCGDQSGQPLIFVHGVGVNLTQWYYFKRACESQYKIVLVDLVGYGISKASNSRKFTLDEYGQDLINILNYANADNKSGKKPVVIGHSMGGMIILNLFQKSPEKFKKLVEKIVLLNTTHHNPIKTNLLGEPLSSVQNILIIPLIYLNLFLSAIARFINLLSYLNGTQHISVAITGFSGEETWPELDFAAQYSFRESMRTISRNFLDMSKYDVNNSLSQINLHTLIITSKSDITTIPEASQFLNNHIPSSMLVTLKHSAHMSILEEPFEIWRQIETFAAKD